MVIIETWCQTTNRSQVLTACEAPWIPKLVVVGPGNSFSFTFERSPFVLRWFTTGQPVEHATQWRARLKRRG
jgi:hypothetical protein